ncbi:MAG: YdcH family protein [Pyrinomonadaceae bacterium]|nr:YdcH family protein [Pyrinomonadaceae bacterium]MCX7641000.1 YdcH family protein [Pyrinomonadaceae bacterium]MDW8305076.1 YdcH family protein [Acidobacteriota bacterium]
MDNTTMNLIRDELMKEDASFRELVITHQNLEKRLSELASIHYPTQEEQLEEALLKRKKLAIKDEIYSRILRHSKNFQKF